VHTGSGTGGFAAETIYEALPIPTFEAEFLSPIGSTLATFEVVLEGKEAVSRCRGRCPAGLLQALDGMGPVDFRNLFCGSPALGNPNLYDASSWRHDAVTGILDWTGTADFAGRSFGARVSLSKDKDSNGDCERLVGPGDPTGDAIVLETSLKAYWWQSAALKVLWRGCVQNGRFRPTAVSAAAAQGLFEILVHEFEAETILPN
jgi:hypothetical protein